MQNIRLLKNLFDVVSLFNGISNLVDYVIPKPSFLKKSSGTMKPIAAFAYKTVHIFP